MTVDDVLQSVLPRLAGGKGTPGCSVFDAIRGVQSIIVNLLLLKRSDLISQRLELTLGAGESNATLPLGYSSMAQRPYVSEGKVLAPLMGAVTSDLLVGGKPSYYDVIGRAFSVYPPPEEEVLVKVEAFVRPELPAAPDDELPFQGAFDEVYAWGALTVMLEGQGALSDRGFVNQIESQVNGVLAAKNMADEQMMADAINYGFN